MPGRDKEALLFPQRVKDWSKTFQLQKTCDGSYFSKPVGQEFDKFDDVMVKYMRTQDRGLIPPIKGTEWGRTTHVPKASAYLSGTKGVFLSTDEYPDQLSATKPLLDRSNTPRGVLRSITLDRNYTNQRWLYTKNSCDGFDPRLTKIDIKRSKDLKRITRREDK